MFLFLAGGMELLAAECTGKRFPVRVRVHVLGQNPTMLLNVPISKSVAMYHL